MFSIKPDFNSFAQNSTFNLAKGENFKVFYFGRVQSFNVFLIMGQLKRPITPVCCFVEFGMCPQLINMNQTSPMSMA